MVGGLLQATCCVITSHSRCSINIWGLRSQEVGVLGSWWMEPDSGLFLLVPGLVKGMM